MTDPTFWNQFLVWPILNLLLVFYKLFEFLRFPGPMGFAVIAMTVVIRLALYPLMKTQMASARKMAKLKPQLDEINKTHKDNKQALQQAQLNLYREHGINPAAGCLPLLVQMPFLIALYNVFYQVLGNGDLNSLTSQINQVVYHGLLKVGTLDLTFFGVSLGIKPSEWNTYGPWLLLVPVVTGALQYWQSKLMTAQQPLNSNPPAGGPNSKQLLSSKKTNPKEGDKKDAKNETDMASDIQKQMMMIMPVMFGMFAYQFPLGLSLYWNIFGVFGIIQQMKVNREN